MKNTLTFKRLNKGDKFNHKGENFRKVSERGAFRIKPSGTGETHAEVPFSRSALVALDHLIA